jgi:hypothetical protein
MTRKSRVLNSKQMKKRGTPERKIVTGSSRNSRNNSTIRVVINTTKVDIIVVATTSPSIKDLWVSSQRIQINVCRRN